MIANLAASIPRWREARAQSCAAPAILPIAGVAGNQLSRKLQRALQILLLVLVVLCKMLDGHGNVVGRKLLPELHGETPLPMASCEPRELQQAIDIEVRPVAREEVERFAFTITPGTLVEMSRPGEHISTAGARIVVTALERRRQHHERKQIQAIMRANAGQSVSTTVSNPVEPGLRHLGARQIIRALAAKQTAFHSLQTAIGPTFLECASCNVQKIHV